MIFHCILVFIVCDENMWAYIFFLAVFRVFSLPLDSFGYYVFAKLIECANNNFTKFGEFLAIKLFFFFLHQSLSFLITLVTIHRSFNPQVSEEFFPQSFVLCYSYIIYICFFKFTDSFIYYLYSTIEPIK